MSHRKIFYIKQFRVVVDNIKTLSKSDTPTDLIAYWLGCFGPKYAVSADDMFYGLAAAARTSSKLEDNDPSKHSEEEK